MTRDRDPAEFVRLVETDPTSLSGTERDRRSILLACWAALDKLDRIEDELTNYRNVQQALATVATKLAETKDAVYELMRETT